MGPAPARVPDRHNHPLRQVLGIRVVRCQPRRGHRHDDHYDQNDPSDDDAAMTEQATTELGDPGRLQHGVDLVFKLRVYCFCHVYATRIRGSSKALSKSDTKVKTTYNNAMISTIAWTTGKSALVMDCQARKPTPWRENTVSMTTEPPSMKP